MESAGTTARTTRTAGAPRVAVVVPALDEEAALRACLPALVALGAPVVVADGGSRDATRAVAAALGARVVQSAPGRGVQLDAGARAAPPECDVLLFLHADTRLPPGALAEIAAAVAAGAEGGGFRLRFDVDSPLYRLGGALASLRTRLTRLPLGDQAQFVRRDVFDALGGYRDWPILEDLDLARRLRRRGRLVVLRGAVTTSARRFVQRGALRTVLTNWAIWALFALGASPRRLAALYRHVR